MNAKFTNGEGSNPFRELYLSLNESKKVNRRKFFKQLAEAKKLAEEAIKPRPVYMPYIANNCTTMVYAQ